MDGLVAEVRRPIGVAMNGVTGRMGTNQHLIRSVLAIRAHGGVPAADGTRLWPEPVLVGRDERKLRTLAGVHGLERWSTSLDECLVDPTIDVYFDAQTTALREAAVRAAIAAGKHVYCEKPLAANAERAIALAREADAAGVAHGVVHDKLYLPGLRKLRGLIEADFFGTVLSVRGEFGYWVFEGDWQQAQRPSWNYRKEEGGGIVDDMFPHWQYVLAGLFGEVRAVSCRAATLIPERMDEQGRRYAATAEDFALGSFELDGGLLAHITSSWATRVDRGELFELHVDGTHGSAVAGLRHCRVQPRSTTPRAVWNPDMEDPHDHREGWMAVPDNEPFDNAFKVQWEEFLLHVADGAPYPWDFMAGVRGVQLAELAKRSDRERRWIDVLPLSV